MSEPSPSHDFTHLWNDLPYEERHRLMPSMIETHKLHVWQCKQKAISAHKKHMKELNDLMANLDAELNKYLKELESSHEAE